MNSCNVPVGREGGFAPMIRHTEDDEDGTLWSLEEEEPKPIKLVV